MTAISPASPPITPRPCGGNGHRPQPAWRGGRPWRRTACLGLCWLESDFSVTTVVCRGRGAEWDFATQHIASPEQAAILRRSAGKAARWCVLLPRSLYLQRLLEIPRVPAAEADAILRLEILAALPPRYGEFECSWRQLEPRKEGLDRCEVYVARRQDVDEYLARVRQLGLGTDLLVPTALAWSGVLRLTERTDLLLAPMGDGQIEVAARGPAGSVLLRVLDVPKPQGLASAEFAARASEAIRSLVPHRDSPADGPPVVGWLGDAAALEGSVLHQAVQADAWETLLGTSGAGLAREDHVFGKLAALALASSSEADVRSSDITPRHELRGREQTRLRRHVFTAAALSLLALALVFAGMWIRIGRLRGEALDLSRRAAVIRRDGELVATRLEQLEAVRAACQTRGDFAAVVAALCAATPKGVSYSAVELTDAGVIRLQGQAESLELPFRLVEALEQQPRLKEVVMRDANRSRRGGGSVAEFRVEAKIKREAIR